MKRNKAVLTSVRIDEGRARRWGEIAQQLGVSQNQAFAILIDNAVVVSRPQVEVSVNKNSSVSLSQGTHAAIGS